MLVLATVVAAGATPIIVTSGGAQSTPPPASNPAHPVVDAAWIYSQDWYNATHFIYKRAGSDGCLAGATSCAFGSPGDANNLPMNYNGTQEFNKWWGDLGVSSTAQPNGNLGKFMSKRDNIYPQSTYQINVQELTIPGAACPGQQVMLAFHPDSQNVSAPNPGTSATPYSSMYSGDWGTGSPYDSNMGALMNLEEIGSVLRWHEANGTYPKRTIKSAVYDAELQGLVGSGFYSSTGGGATNLTAPASIGSTKLYVASVSALNAAQSSGIFAVGQPVAIDDVDTENNVVQAIGTAARTATTLAAAASAGDSNIKVASVTNIVAGEPIRLEAAGNSSQEFATVQTVGTAGATGTGVTLSAPLTSAHASGVAAQDLGTGITLAAPIQKAHAAGSTINGPTSGLISDGPQGQIVGVLNNDQNGINYPALHWGTDHYLNDLINGGVGPWFNNINATPVTNTGAIYSTAGFARLQANLANVTAFRTNVESAVTNAIHDLGEKYNYSIPVGNPMMFKNTGSTPDNPTPAAIPSYLPADQAKYTPVNDDRTGRTDQVSFGNRGIPSLGNIGVYDSSTNPAVGGNENPYPASYPNKPGISFLYGQDTMSDNFPNLNFYAGGQVHGPGGYDKPSEGLLRGVEFVATYFSYAVASDALGGKTPKPTHPVAFFEQSPKKATATRTVTYDAGFSRDADGSSAGLEYYWDFGDGSAPQKTNNPRVTHTFPSQAGWHDVKLLVSKGDGTKTTANVGTYRQVEPINFAPTYYPATPPAGEPQAPTTGPAADPCGTLSSDELASFVSTANGPVQGAPIQDQPVSGNVPATLSLTLGGAASFGAFAPGVAKTYDTTTTADVVSTAGDAALSWSGPNHLTNGAFTMTQPFTVDLSKSSWSAPVSHDSVTIGFHQPIAATDPLRTGNYSATVTFTLSTTNP
ncbi:PKD domain-containing protein [Solirubrobacter soli]|uniref:PKD domain-containing protein n=1 Tax=Solirubrobacter soli TaxID=363832 RepID=UPI0003F8A19A|nr:PKD domain-containing protein [Solirubrobacter soli]